MQLSVVSTLYRSAPHLTEFYDRVSREAERITSDHEIVLVNDGSPDRSLALALEIQAHDDRIRVVDLSRNFGHHKAMMTGLSYAHGELVFLIDSDLEEEPELLGRFHRELQVTGADVVFGVQEGRRGNLAERLSGRIFFWAFNLLSNDRLPANLVTVRLMTSRYVRSLLEHREHETIIAGLWAITGYQQVPLSVKKASSSETTYDLRRKLVLLVNSVTSFSDRPLVFIFYLGVAILALSSLAASYLVIRRVFFGVLLGGWPSLIVSVWMLGGLTLFCLGIVAIYLSKVFKETKGRPYTIVRQVYDRRADVR
ncbi:MAG: glycosyltransferase family 2 protein [Burkholderiales bacterium]